MHPYLIFVTDSAGVKNFRLVSKINVQNVYFTSVSLNHSKLNYTKLYLYLDNLFMKVPTRFLVSNFFLKMVPVSKITNMRYACILDQSGALSFTAL